MQPYILRVKSPDTPGIVSSVSGHLFDAGFNIEDASQFNDHLSGHFFMRIAFLPMNDSAGINDLKCSFQKLADKFEMDWSIHPVQEKIKTLLMVSKADHCLEDILYRVRTNHLPLDITGVASNHDLCRELVESRGIPYYHLPITRDTKRDQERQVEALISETGSELVVMARYMQILTDQFCEKYAGRVINIHHSFLPGFKGARPYHQAWERGVKMIGATAHFATGDLDEGPIIDQETKRITHKMTPENLEVIGKDIEAQLLSKSLLSYAERRIFLHGNRTVIL